MYSEHYHEKKHRWSLSSEMEATKMALVREMTVQMGGSECVINPLVVGYYEG